MKVAGKSKTRLTGALMVREIVIETEVDFRPEVAGVSSGWLTSEMSRCGCKLPFLFFDKAQDVRLHINI